MKLENVERVPGSVMITVSQGDFFACCRITDDVLATLSRASLIDVVARQVVEVCNLVVAGGRPG